MNNVSSVSIDGMLWHVSITIVTMGTQHCVPFGLTTYVAVNSVINWHRSVGRHSS